MVPWLLWINAFIAATLSFIGLIILVRNNKLVTNRLFFLFALSISCWIMTNYLSNVQTLSDATLLWMNKLTLFVPGVSMIFLLQFAHVVTGKQYLAKYMASITSLFGLAYVTAITPWVIEGVRHQDPVVAIHFGFLAPLYFLTLLVNILLVVSVLRKGIRSSKQRERIRLRIITVSVVSAILVNVITNAAIPYLQGSFLLTNLGPLSMSIVVVGLFYGITRHQLFDIRAVVARSVGYVLSVAALAAIYISIVFTLGGKILDTASATEEAERFLAATGAVLLAFIFQPVKNFFDKLTQRVFYRDAYATEDYIDKLNHTLVSTLELNTLVSGVSTLIKTTLKADFVEFLVHDGQGSSFSEYAEHKKIDSRMLSGIKRLLAEHSTSKVVILDYIESENKKTIDLLRDRGIAAVGRIGSDRDHQLLAYLVLGTKKSGNPYTKQDKSVLEATVNELLIAIQNALRFEEIEAFNETLQQRIDDATRQLRHSNEKLKQLDETKDDFISMASHQLRTPLTSIKGYVSMVLDGDAGKVSPLQQKLLGQAFISSQRMVYLISDLLNVSRLRTGKFIVEPTVCNLAEIVSEEVKQLVETAKGRNLELAYQKPEHFPELMLDETKMRQVIMNFIDNAIYYTPAGGTITVALKETPKSVEFTVTDTGIGVPKSEQHHLFSKFYRAHNAKRARPDGTGLGLFMARKVILAQGGATIFRSQEGKGSVFGFTFSKEALLPKKNAPSVAKAAS